MMQDMQRPCTAYLVIKHVDINTMCHQSFHHTQMAFLGCHHEWCKLQHNKLSIHPGCSGFTQDAQRSLETCMLHMALCSSSHRRNVVYTCGGQQVIACSRPPGSYSKCNQPAYLNGISLLKVAVSTQGLQLVHHLHMAFISSTQQRTQALQRQKRAVAKVLITP